MKDLFELEIKKQYPFLKIEEGYYKIIVYNKEKKLELFSSSLQNLLNEFKEKEELLFLF